MGGAKKHMAWHGQQKDTWTWTGFFVETGRKTGMHGWISNPAAAGSTFPLVNVEHFTVHSARQQEFMGALQKAHGALQKAGYKLPYWWSRQVSGAEGMVFTLAAPMTSWTNIAENPEVQQMMVKQPGEQGMANLMQNFYDSIVTVENWTARIFQELSYTPGM